MHPSVNSPVWFVQTRLPSCNNMHGALMKYSHYIQSGCGSKNIIDASTDIHSITSPNFPNDYPSNIACSWVIGVERNQAIQMTFTAFDLEDDFDFLYVRNYYGY